MECFGKIRQMRVLDMHAHLFCLGEEWEKQEAEKEAREQEQDAQKRAMARKQAAVFELELRKKSGIATCLSSGTPEQWQFLQQFGGREEILLSFGIHPWYADRFSPEDYREYFEACDLIGEIGMDSVWCQVPLSIQQKNLDVQLQIAAGLGKPVLLHTKGQEKEIAGMLRGFPNPICVHWYSGDLQTLENYIELGCYFTLGPDFTDRFDSPLYQKMVREIPAERLFLETDGISAVAWAKGVETLPLTELSPVLERNLKTLAISDGREESLRRQQYENLQKFLQRQF